MQIETLLFIAVFMRKRIAVNIYSISFFIYIFLYCFIFIYFTYKHTYLHTINRVVRALYTHILIFILCNSQATIFFFLFICKQLFLFHLAILFFWLLLLLMMLLLHYEKCKVIKVIGEFLQSQKALKKQKKKNIEKIEKMREKSTQKT